MKLIPRFSLRTLLLVVLLIGSSATLWWNWGPWMPARRIEFSGPDCFAEFDPSGRWIITDQHWNIDSSKKQVRRLRVFDPATGVQKLDLREQRACEVHWFIFSEGGEYVSYDNQEENVGRRCRKLWRVDTGEPVDLFGFMHELPKWLTFAAQDRVVLLSGEHQHVVLSLPEKIVKLRLPLSEWICLTLDGRWVIDPTPTQVAIYSVESGKLDHAWNPPLNAEKVFYTSPLRTKLAFIATSSLGSRSTIICDALSGKELNRFDGSGEEDWCSNFADERHYVQDQKLWRLEPEQKLFALTLPRCDSNAFNGIDGDLLHFYRNVLWEKGACFGQNQGPTTFDLKTESTLWQGGKSAHFCENREFATDESHRDSIVSTRTGATLFTLSPTRWPNELSGEVFISFSPRAPEFLTTRTVLSSAQPNLDPAAEPRPATMHVTLWTLIRPFAWYGPAYLPEFWLSLVLGAGFLWSVWRDRRLGMRA